MESKDEVPHAHFTINHVHSGCRGACAEAFIVVAARAPTTGPTAANNAIANTNRDQHSECKRRTWQPRQRRSEANASSTATRCDAAAGDTNCLDDAAESRSARRSFCG